MSIRPYKADDRSALADIWSAAFMAGRELEKDQPEISDDAPIFVADKNGEPIGCFRIHKIRHTLRGEQIAAGGIGGVAVSPEQRQTGVGKEMMIWALQTLRGEGIPLASLYAYSEGYYRMLGFECCGLRYLIQCPSHEIPKPKSQLPASHLAPSDWPALQDVYHRFAKNYSGMIVRDEKWWKRAVQLKASDRHIYAIGDPIDAYIIVKFTPDFWVDQPIDEVVWTTAESYRGVQSLLAGIAVNRSSVSWTEPSDGPFLQTNFQKATLKAPIMFRIVDIAAAVRLLVPQSKGEFSFEVADALLPENCGPWKVSFGEGSVEVSACSNADLRFTEKSFAQALFGQPSLVDLLRSGVVSAFSDCAVEAACKLLPAHPTQCIDFF